MTEAPYFYVVLEGSPPNIALQGLIHEEILETGRRLLVFEDEETFLQQRPRLQAVGEILEEGRTRGEILRLPSGLAIKAFGEAGEKTILLRTKGAFGSGFHPTTRLCLQILDSLSPDPHPALDLGAGTGILALLLARKGWPGVVAVEPEPQAVKVLRENVSLNHLEEQVLPVRGDLSAVKGPFSLIVANLYLRILIPEARNLASLLLPGGRLVLSGFLASSFPALKRAYGSLALEQEITFRGWGAASFVFTP